MKIMRKPRAKWLLAGAAVAAVGGAAWGLSILRGASTDIDPSRLATVERGAMVRSVVATGKVEPVTKVEIKSKANGIIEKLFVDVDQLVEPGQILAELDKENLNARLREARANLKAAEAAHEGAAGTAREEPDRGRGARRRVRAAQLARAEQLFEQKLVSQSSLDEARTCPRAGRKPARAAAGQLVVARARVVEADANVAQARAAVERAEEELANSTIRAPIRATVLTRDVEVGSPVSSILNLGANATLVMTLGDIQKVFVRGKVDEADIGEVRLGQQARITTETFRERVFDGKVTQISPYRRREGQRHDLCRGSVDRQSRQGAQGQHDGKCRDRPRAAAGVAPPARGGRHLRCATQRVRRCRRPLGPERASAARA